MWFFSKNRKACVCVIGIQLFLILAFRSDSLGVDLGQYKLMYDAYTDNSFVDIIKGFHLFGYSDVLFGRESGYVLLNWICSNLGMNFHGFLVVQSAICVFSVCFFVYRYSKVPWLSFSLVIALGLYTYMFCILRQSLAVAFLFFAFPYIIERNLIKFLICICFASLFHVVALCYLPLYWIANKQVSIKNVVVGIFISIFFPIFFKGFTILFLNSFGKSYVFSSGILLNKMLFFFLFVIFFLLLFYRDVQFSKKIDKSVMFWGFFFTLPVEMMSLFMPILGRAAIGMFLPLAAILIPNTLYENKDEYSQPFFFLLVFVLFFGYFMIDFCSSGAYLIPYERYNG